MRASRLQLTFYKRCRSPSQFFSPAHPRHGPLTLFDSARETNARASISTIERFDPAKLRVSVGKRRISALDRMHSELVLQRFTRWARLGYHEQPRGILVDAMHDAGPIVLESSRTRVVFVAF